MFKFVKNQLDHVTVIAKLMSWNWYLVIIAGTLWLVNVAIFYPGYMSPDSLSQLSQATGVLPVTDWHPPVMELLWHLLIVVTNHTSSMLMFQTLWLWSSLLLMTLVIYSATKSRKISLLPFMFAFLPIILNISGVIWKDVHMAFALLLSSSLLIAVAALKPNKKLRYIAIAFSIIFIIYATLVRYNAFISVLPLIYLVAIQFSWASSKLRIGLIMLAVLGTVGVGSVLVNAIAKPQSTHPIAAIMLDDIINAVPRQDIESSNIPDKLKNVLLKSQAKCKAYEAVRNAFWACVDIGPDQEVISISHADQLIGFWSKSVIAHPLSYLSYRAQTFLMFLVVPEDTEYVWHEGITPNELGQTVKFERAENIMKHYIVDWAYRYFPFLFQGWFWLLVGLFTFRLANQKSQFGIYSKSIALSGVLYILLYIPIVVAMDYRYIYWPVIATILAGGLIILDQYTKPRVREKRKS